MKRFENRRQSARGVRRRRATPALLALVPALVLAWAAAAVADGEPAPSAVAPAASEAPDAASASSAYEEIGPEGWAYDVWNELMSPFCPGRTLADCPSPQAGSLRSWIVVQEAAGRSKDDVLDELYARYGDQIRSAPRAEGFGTAAYVIPVVAFLLGGVIVAVFLVHWTRRGGGGPPAGPPPALDPELQRRLDEEFSP